MAILRDWPRAVLLLRQYLEADVFEDLIMAYIYLISKHTPQVLTCLESEDISEHCYTITSNLLFSSNVPFLVLVYIHTLFLID
jgi:hypothetical protein